MIFLLQDNDEADNVVRNRDSDNNKFSGWMHLRWKFWDVRVLSPIKTEPKMRKSDELLKWQKSPRKTRYGDIRWRDENYVGWSMTDLVVDGKRNKDRAGRRWIDQVYMYTRTPEEESVRGKWCEGQSKV